MACREARNRSGPALGGERDNQLVYEVAGQAVGNDLAGRLPCQILALERLRDRRIGRPPLTKATYCRRAAVVRATARARSRRIGGLWHQGLRQAQREVLVPVRP